MGRLDYPCRLHIVLVTLATASVSCASLYPKELRDVIFLKDGFPAEIRCPLVEEAIRKDGRFIKDAYEKYRQGSLNVMWKKRSCRDKKRQLLASVYVHGGVTDLESFAGSRVFERKVGGGNYYREYPLWLSTVSFEGCETFLLEWEMFADSRSCSHKCIVEYSCVFNVFPSTVFPPSLSFSSPPPEEEFRVRLDPPSGSLKPKLRVKLQNVTREIDGLHSIVEWRVLDGVTILDSSENYRSSVITIWNLTNRNGEEAMIQLQPKITWKNFNNLRLEVTARNHYVSLPWMTISRSIYVRYGPSQPSLIIHNGVVQQSENDYPWLSVHETIHVECLLLDCGHPCAQVSGNVAGFEGLNFTQTKGYMEWRGTLVIPKKPASFVTFTCEVKSKELNLTRSVEKMFSVAYVKDLEVILSKPIVDEGGEVNLSCSFRGNPPPEQYEWEMLRDGSIYSLPYTTDTITLFGMDTSRWTHFVSYRCGAINPITREKRVSAPATLKVKFEAGAVQCEKVSAVEAIAEDEEEEEEEKSLLFSNSTGVTAAHGFGSHRIRGQKIDRVDRNDSPRELQLVCAVFQYPLMPLEEFQTLVIIHPSLGFSRGSINVTTAVVKGVDDPRSGLRRFLVDIRALNNVCFNGSLEIQHQLFPISLVTSVAGSEPRTEESSNRTHGFLLPIVVPLLLMAALIAIVVILWNRKLRIEAGRSENIESWQKNVQPLFVPPPLQYHSSLLYDRVMRAMSAYESNGQKPATRRRSPSDESEASNETDLSNFSASSPFYYHLSMSGGGGGEKTFEEQADIASHEDDSCFDSLPYYVNIGPSTVTCTALVHHQAATDNDYVEDPSVDARMRSASEIETAEGYLNIIPSPYVNVVMGKVPSHTSRCPSLETTASDIYVNLPRWADVGQRGILPPREFPDVSLAIVDLDSIGRRSARSSTETCPRSLPLSSIEHEGVENEFAEIELQQNQNTGADDTFFPEQEDQVFRGN